MLTRSRKAQQRTAQTTLTPFPYPLPLDVVRHIFDMLPRDGSGCFMEHSQRQTCMLVSRSWASAMRAYPESGWTVVHGRKGTYSSPSEGLKQLYSSLSHAQKAGGVSAMHIVLPKVDACGVVVDLSRASSRDLQVNRALQLVPPFSYQGLYQRLRITASQLQWLKLSLQANAPARPSLEPLFRCMSHLTLLDLSKCEFPPSDLPKLVPHIQHVKTLLLTSMREGYSYWPGLTGEVLASLTCLPRLTRLRVGLESGHVAMQVEAIACLTKLTHLEMTTHVRAHPCEDVGCPASSFQRLSALTSLHTLKCALPIDNLSHWINKRIWRGGAANTSSRAGLGPGVPDRLKGFPAGVCAQLAAWDQVLASIQPSLRRLDVLVQSEELLPTALHALTATTAMPVRAPITPRTAHTAMRMPVLTATMLWPGGLTGQPLKPLTQELATLLAAFPAVHLQYLIKLIDDVHSYPLFTLPNVLSVRAGKASSKRSRVWRPQQQPWSRDVCPCYLCREGSSSSTERRWTYTELVQAAAAAAGEMEERAQGAAAAAAAAAATADADATAAVAPAALNP